MANRQIRRRHERRLEDLVSVGPATRGGFELLGIRTVSELARSEPEDLYRKLCRKTGKRQDVCVLDVFRAAVEQARNPLLPPEQCVWWYWSRIRKAAGAFSTAGSLAGVHRKRTVILPSGSGYPESAGAPSIQLVQALVPGFGGRSRRDASDDRDHRKEDMVLLAPSLISAG
jgi:hypothetical protein